MGSKKILTALLMKRYGVKDIEINKVEMDSKKIEKGDLFLAIGRGNDYIEEGLKKGASLVIGDRGKVDDSRVIYVEDTIKEMGNLAKEYRKNLNIKVIGITGTNGKTSTKDIIDAILSTKYKGHKTLGNHNNHIGLPFTILSVDDSDEYLVLEMGMSNLGEIGYLCSIANPDYGVITNIGESHLEFLKTVDNVFKAKSELLNYVEPKNRILNGDDPYLKDLEGRKISIENEKSNLRASEIVESEEGIIFNIEGNEYRIPLNGRYNVLNTLLGIEVGKIFKVESSKIKEALIDLKLSNMRYERVKIDGILYINDAYNADPTAMREALKSFDNLYNGGRCYKIAVLGDMFELGEREVEYHIGLGDTLKNLRCEKILLLGKNMRYLWKSCEDNRIMHLENIEEVRKEIKKISKEISKNIIVFLKGSRGMALEKVIK